MRQHLGHRHNPFGPSTESYKTLANFNRPLSYLHEGNLIMPRDSLRRFLAIVGGSTGLACLLGIALDLVTANVAVEYFTIHHPKIIESQNPFVMALLWGVIASWWFGAAAGLLAATTNHFRSSPLPPKLILRWVAIACAILWCLMIAILIAVLLFASTIPESMRRPTFDLDRRLMAVALAHQFEYLLGAIAALIITLRIGFKRFPIHS